MDRQIQFQRATETEDAFGGSSLVWSDIGDVIPALREDVSDTQKVQAGVFRERSLIRFQVRSSEFTRGITADDRIQHEGHLYGINGIKEPQRGQRRQLLEFSCEGPLT
jgi:head-tail adaptor